MNHWEGCSRSFSNCHRHYRYPHSALVRRLRFFSPFLPLSSSLWWFRFVASVFCWDTFSYGASVFVCCNGWMAFRRHGFLPRKPRVFHASGESSFDDFSTSLRFSYLSLVGFLSYAFSFFFNTPFISPHRRCLGLIRVQWRVFQRWDRVPVLSFRMDPLGVRFLFFGFTTGC